MIDRVDSNMCMLERKLFFYRFGLLLNSATYCTSKLALSLSPGNGCKILEAPRMELRIHKECKTHLRA